MHEIDDALPRRLVRVVVKTGAAQADAGFGRHVGHFRKHQSGPADRPRAVMHEMPIVRGAVRRQVTTPRHRPKCRSPRAGPDRPQAGFADNRARECRSSTRRPRA